MVKIKFRRYEFEPVIEGEIEEVTKSVLEPSPYSCSGAVEYNAGFILELVRAFGRLLNILYRNKMLTRKELKEVLGK